jgi:hypothetical protein
VRWDEKRLTAYAEYASAVGDITGIAIRMAAARGLPSPAAPLDPKDGLPLLLEAEARRGAKWQTVQLLGDPTTVSAARRWHECAWRLDGFAKGRFDGSEEFQAAWKSAGIARTQYYAAARASLGVQNGDLPQPPEEVESARQEKARRQLSD